MKHTFKIDNYEDLKSLLKDIKKSYCENCQERTFHLICGFKESNYRLECLKCENGRS